jgi:hypothetical protein
MPINKQKAPQMTIEEFLTQFNLINDRKGQVELLATFILETKKKTNSKKTLSTKDVVSEYEILRNENDNLPQIPENTIMVYLNQLANSSESQINCPGRKQGYYLDLLLKEIGLNTQDEAIQGEEELKIAKEKGTLLEKDLYPFLEQWLFEVENERVSDISGNRGQGKWANPDLLGLKIDYFFQAPQIELTTIEAKILIDGWEQWIFEAVAHTVFSNRSYFAFVHSEEHLNKIPHEIRHYSEKFCVGILIIAVDPKDYLKIQKREAFKLTTENHKIVEYIPAPYQTPHLKFQKRFLVGLGVKDQKDLLNFGKSLEK